MTQWSERTRLQPVLFEWEHEPQVRGVRLVSEPAQVGDPVRVTGAGVEVEGRIEAVEAATLRVRISVVVSSNRSAVATASARAQPSLP